MALRFAVLPMLIVAAGAAAVSESASEASRVNPIRRVVTMLQMMSNKIQAEGEQEAELYQKFQCYCTTGASTLEASISDAETKIPQVQSALDESVAEKAQLEADLERHHKDVDDAKTAMAEATALRKKEADSFGTFKADAEANIGAMEKAIAALEKGMGGAFLQTAAAQVLSRFAASPSVGGPDRATITAFLSGNPFSQGAGNEASGQITGMLKQMLETLEDDLADATKVENKAIADYEALIAAKEKLVVTLTRTIEEKTARLGEVGVAIVNLKEDLADTTEALAADKKFLADLDGACKTKAAEHDARSKLRTTELLAIADTVKILNSDDALELFKKTLPTPSLLQVRESSKKLATEATRRLQGARGHHDPRLDLISLALNGRKVNFDKIVVMINDMVKLLQSEQVSDNKKKAYCTKSIDEAEDEGKVLDRDLMLLEKAIEKNTAAIEQLTEEIASLTAGVIDLDKKVAEATQLRQQEHEEYETELKANTAAAEILAIAKNRLRKFYDPKLHKAAPKRDLSEEERIVVNEGGTLAPTAPPGGISGTGVEASLVQVSAHSQLKKDAPPPPPETWGAYKKKGGESSGVIEMINLLIADLENDITTSKTDEEHAQESYQQFVKDSAVKRSEDSKLIADKDGVLAETNALKGENQRKHKSKLIEAMDNAKYLGTLHLDCDWLLAAFETRAAARTAEIDSLERAKAVLAGADFS